MGRLSQTLSQPIRCPGKRDVSYYASKATSDRLIAYCVPSSLLSLISLHAYVFVFFTVTVDISKKWVIQTLSWTCGLSACALCSGGAAPRLTGLRPSKAAPNLSHEQLESPCWSDK